MSPIVSGGGSGGSQPDVGAVYYSNVDTNVPPTTLTRLSWADSFSTGTPLFDITTDPLNPATLAAGTYNIGLGVYSDEPLDANTLLKIELQLDADHIDILSQSASQAVTAANNVPAIPVTLEYPLPAARKICVFVYHTSADARNFFLFALITKKG